MQVRASTPDDAAAIHDVLVQAFGGDVEARLVALLLAADAAPVSLVAEVDGQVVGYILFSPVEIVGGAEPTPVRMAGLAPLAVAPAFQRRGVGACLAQAGLAACAEAGFQGVVVLGDPGYYRRFGFERASDRGLASEYGVDDEFMALELEPGGLAGVRGLVRYRSEFRAVGA
jgi:putative acetyltransferase